MSETAARTLVLGVGNPLLSDEGLGVAVVERLVSLWRFDPPVELVDGGTWGLSLLPAVEAAERLLIVDAIDIAAQPGTHITLEREELPRLFALKLSPHQIDLREVLALAELRGALPREAVAIGVQPFSFEWCAELSPQMQAEVDTVVARIIERLRCWGHLAQPLYSPTALTQ